MRTDFDIDLIGKEDMFVCGDCMEYMKWMSDKCVELAIVDPPYGVKYARGKNGWGICDNRPDLKEVQWDNVPKKKYFDELIRISKNQIIWGGNYYTDKIPVSKCWIVWDKICETENKSVFADCELAWTSFSKVCKLFKLRVMGFINDSKESRIHPTQKPIALYEWLLQRYANPGDTILDTHVGSASSLIACHNTNHRFVGFELSKEYYGLAKDRYESETSQMRLTDFMEV